MGVVHRAEDTLDPSRAIALKLLQPGGPIDAEASLRFKEEFRAMTRLRHPNTIEVLDFGQVDEETLFLTMELVEGRDLSSYVGENLPLERLYPVLLDLLQALEFIHSRGYVHRDITSRNVRLRADGVLKLMDFGLMERLGTPSNGDLTGTAGYMPPEVPRGGMISAASDLYSVGCLAYELITGHLPFEGDFLSVVRAQTMQPPKPLGRFRADIPPALETWVARLLEKDPRRRFQEAGEAIAALSELSGLRAAPTSAEPTMSYLVTSTLVGRERELTRLLAELEAASSGTPRSVFIGASAGIGKSRLARDLLVQAKLDGALVLEGQCREHGMAPYAPLIQALRPAIAQMEPTDRARFGPELARLFPELGPPPPPSSDRSALHEAVVSWLVALGATRTVVLAIDDLHWADPSTVEVVNQLIREPGEHRLLTLATFRSDEVPPGSPLRFTVDEGLTHHLALTGFDRDQVLLLVRAMLRRVEISPEFEEVLYAATAGNAFFLSEVLRYLVQEGRLVRRHGVWHFPAEIDLVLPTSVEATVVQRVGQLSPGARHLAGVAASLGRYQVRELWLRVSDLSEDDFFAGLDELIARQFIVRLERRYAFTHDRVREALYVDHLEDGRRSLHQRAAEVLETRRQEADLALVSELAYHYRRGLDQVKAFEYLRQAGNLARDAGMLVVALSLWTQADETLAAIAYSDKERHLADLWYDLGTNALEISPSLSARFMEKLLALLESEGDLERLGVVPRAIGRLVMRLPRSVRDPLLTRMTTRAPYQFGRLRRQRFDPAAVGAWLARHLEILSYLAGALGLTGAPLRGEAYTARAFRFLPFPGTPIEALMLLGKASVMIPLGRLDESTRAAQRAESLLAAWDVGGHAAFVTAKATTCTFQLFRCWQGIRPDSELLALGLQRADEAQSPGSKSMLWGACGLWSAQTGRSGETQGYLDLMDDNAKRMGAPPHRIALFIRCLMLYLRGEYPEALAQTEKALQYPNVAETFTVHFAIRMLRGQIKMALGDLEEAGAIFASGEARCREAGLDLSAMQLLVHRTELCARRGERHAAQELAEEAYRMATSIETRNPLIASQAARWLSELALADGQRADSDRWWQAAWGIASSPEQDNMLEQGRLQRLRGDWLYAGGDATAALAAYDRAIALFFALDNRYLARQVVQVKEAVVASTPAPRDKKPRPGHVVSAVHRSLTRSIGRHSRDYEHMSDRLRKLQLINDVSLALSATLKLDRVLSLILQHSLTLSGGEQAYVLLGDGMDPTCLASLDSAGKSNDTLEISRSIVRRCLAELKTICILDTHEEVSHQSKSVMALDLRSVMCVPLVANQERIGVLYISSRAITKTFSAEDEPVLEAIANQAALTIRNAQLLDAHERQIVELERALAMVKEAQQRAVTDGLTGLYNHVYFKEQLYNTVQEARRYGRPDFSVILIDLDHFKRINDTYGHQTGDRVLKTVSAQIRGMLRDCDILARYGGEELALLLPQTEQGGAAVVAERIRSAIEGLDMVSVDDQPFKLSASFGVAQYQQGWTETELVERADKALYAAKHGGRNRVCEASPPLR